MTATDPDLVLVRSELLGAAIVLASRHAAEIESLAVPTAEQSQRLDLLNAIVERLSAEIERRRREAA